MHGAMFVEVFSFLSENSREVAKQWVTLVAKTLQRKKSVCSIAALRRTPFAARRRAHRLPVQDPDPDKAKLNSCMACFPVNTRTSGPIEDEMRRDKCFVFVAVRDAYPKDNEISKRAA